MRLSNIKEYKDKNVLVLGLGVSGKSVIKKIAGFVKHITAVDSNPYADAADELDNLKKIKGFHIKLAIGNGAARSTEILNGTDLVIVSPGVPSDNALIKAADKLKIPVWSEIELGWRLLTAEQKLRTIAVTGTNGKTTVVTLLQRILQDAGIDAVVCGNIGNPLVNTIYRKGKESKEDESQQRLFKDETKGSLVRVMEISSFQLERCITFNPAAGIILNITSDHLDRHRSMSNYARIKFSMFKNAGRKNRAILNIDDKYIKRFINTEGHTGKLPFKTVKYSLDPANAHAAVKCINSSIVYDFDKMSGSIDISKISLKGQHNVSNIMSAVAAARLFGASDASIEKTLAGFRTLEHRIEFVGEVNKVRVFNDSKATNPDATIKALESFEREVTLILGGKDKDMDFSILLPVMDKKVINLMLIGETKVKILKILENHSKEVSGLPYNVYVCGNFVEAIEKSFKVTEGGNVLLLSPACASFDMFRDYKDRGNKFKNLVFERLESL